MTSNPRPSRHLLLMVCMACVCLATTACGESEGYTAYKGTGRDVNTDARPNNRTNPTTGGGTSNTTFTPSTGQGGGTTVSSTTNGQGTGQNTGTSTGNTSGTSTTMAPSVWQPEDNLPSALSINANDYFDGNAIPTVIRCDLSAGEVGFLDTTTVEDALGIKDGTPSYVRCMLPPNAQGVQILVDGDDVVVMVRPLLDRNISMEFPEQLVTKPFDVSGGQLFEWSQEDFMGQQLTHIDISLRNYMAIRSVKISATSLDAPGG